MNRLREEMKVIPRLAWAIAVLLLVGLAFAFLYLEFNSNGDSALFFLAPFSIIAVIFFVYILLLGYVAGDARRRGMRAVLWVLLATFMPSAVGFILYFILREPLLRPCPRCGTGAIGSFPYCPSCGASLAAVCPSCKNAVESGWSHCARCGAQLLVA
jgi:hypothetical protein